MTGSLEQYLVNCMLWHQDFYCYITVEACCPSSTHPGMVVKDPTFDYKAAFKERWIRRKEDMEHRRRHRLQAFPPQNPPWFGPHMPGLFPMPPGITGGDYDRLPQPFVPGGPGMLGNPLRQGYRTHQGQGNGRGFGSLGGFRMH